MNVISTTNITWFHLNHDMVSRRTCRIYTLFIYGGHSITAVACRRCRMISHISQNSKTTTKRCGEFTRQDGEKKRATIFCACGEKCCAPKMGAHGPPHSPWQMRERKNCPQDPAGHIVRSTGAKTASCAARNQPRGDRCEKRVC